MEPVNNLAILKELIVLSGSIHCTVSKTKLFEKLINHKLFDNAEWLLSKHPELNNIEVFDKCMRHISYYGQIEKAKWLFNIKSEFIELYDYNQIYVNIMQSGNVEFASWIYSVKPDIQSCFVRFEEISSKGPLEMVQWYYHTYGENIENKDYTHAILKACKKGHLDIAQWLYSMRPTITHDFEAYFQFACKNGYMDIVEWIMSVNPDTDITKRKEYVFTYACRSGKIEAMKWLYFELLDIYDIEIDVNIYDGGYGIKKEIGENFVDACTFGHLDVAKWLLEKVSRSDFEKNYGPIINKALERTCENGHLEVAQWLHLIRPVYVADLSFYQYYEIFKNACIYGNIEIVKWLFEKDSELKEEFMEDIESIFENVCKQYNLNCAKWLYSMKPDMDITMNNHSIFRSLCKTFYWKQREESLEIIKWIISMKEDLYSFKMVVRDKQIILKPIINTIKQKIEVKKCYVCQDVDSTIMTVCKHQYCETCIETWLERSNRCPYCRTRIIEDDFIMIE
jgi:hypothetical protein